MLQPVLLQLLVVWLLAIPKIVAALWMCNWMICNILIEDMWSLETPPLFTLHIA